jgi:hypothetical protein
MLVPCRVMVASFGFMMFKADVPASAVLRGFTVPELPSTYIPTVSACVRDDDDDGVSSSSSTSPTTSCGRGLHTEG